MGHFNLQTPQQVAYPLTVASVLVTPLQKIKKGDLVATFTTADQRSIGIKSPFDAQIGEHVMPENITLYQPTIFLQMHKVENSAAKPEPSVQKKTQTPKQKSPRNTSKPTRSPGKLKSAGLALFLPLLCMLPVVVLSDVAFPDFFKDNIWIRWLLIIGACNLGLFWAAGKPNPTENSIGTKLATFLACLVALPLLFPFEDYKYEIPFLQDFTLSDVFKEKVAGVALDDLEKLSNGRTPTPPQHLSQELANWIND
jgi:hypothetical protein